MNGATFDIMSKQKICALPAAQMTTDIDVSSSPQLLSDL